MRGIHNRKIVVLHVCGEMDSTNESIHSSSFKEL